MYTLTLTQDSSQCHTKTLYYILGGLMWGGDIGQLVVS